jgi:hypothetical protein
MQRTHPGEAEHGRVELGLDVEDRGIGVVKEQQGKLKG